MLTFHERVPVNMLKNHRNTNILINGGSNVAESFRLGGLFDT